MARRQVRACLQLWMRLAMQVMWAGLMVVVTRRVVVALVVALLVGTVVVGIVVMFVGLVRFALRLRPLDFARSSAQARMPSALC